MPSAIKKTSFYSFSDHIEISLRKVAGRYVKLFPNSQRLLDVSYSKQPVQRAATSLLLRGAICTAFLSVLSLCGVSCSAMARYFFAGPLFIPVVVIPCIINMGSLLHSSLPPFNFFKTSPSAKAKFDFKTVQCVLLALCTAVYHADKLKVFAYYNLLNVTFAAANLLPVAIAPLVANIVDWVSSKYLNRASVAPAVATKIQANDGALSWQAVADKLMFAVDELCVGFGWLFMGHALLSGYYDVVSSSAGSFMASLVVSHMGLAVLYEPVMLVYNMVHDRFLGSQLSVKQVGKVVDNKRSPVFTPKPKPIDGKGQTPKTQSNDSGNKRPKSPLLSYPGQSGSDGINQLVTQLDVAERTRQDEKLRAGLVISKLEKEKSELQGKQVQHEEEFIQSLTYIKGIVSTMMSDMSAESPESIAYFAPLNEVLDKALQGNAWVVNHDTSGASDIDDMYGVYPDNHDAETMTQYEALSKTKEADIIAANKKIDVLQQSVNDLEARLKEGKYKADVIDNIKRLRDTLNESVSLDSSREAWYANFYNTAGENEGSSAVGDNNIENTECIDGVPVGENEGSSAVGDNSKENTKYIHGVPEVIPDGDGSFSESSFTSFEDTVGGVDQRVLGLMFLGESPAREGVKVVDQSVDQDTNAYFDCVESPIGSAHSTPTGSDDEQENNNGGSRVPFGEDPLTSLYYVGDAGVTNVHT